MSDIEAPELEPDDTGDHDVPVDMVELFEALAWQTAIEAEADQ